MRLQCGICGQCGPVQVDAPENPARCLVVDRGH